MKAGMQHKMSSKSRTTSLIRLGLFGFVVASALIYNQVSFNSQAKAYDEALAETAAWDNRMSDVLTIRGRINGVVTSVAEMEGSANALQAIESAMSDLQMVWVHHSFSMSIPSRNQVGADVDMITLAAMRTADELRRGDATEARRHALNVLRTADNVYPVLTNLEHEIEGSRQGSDAVRLKALAGMNAGQTIDVSVLFALGVLVVGLLAAGLPSFAGRVRPQPRPAFVTTSRGFSLTEVLMVVAITLVLSTIAIANIATVVSSSRIRAGISSMSGLLQNCRMLAVKKNKTLTAHMTPEGSGTLMGYVKDATDSSPLSATDSQVKWEAPVVRMTTPTGTGAPTAISNSVLGYTPQTGDISFNSRGLPCAYASGVCTNHGFLYYFKDTSRVGSKGWAALSVSPAGKIKKWFWLGASWSE
jgi:prepilin-type N-terminal cleavage/methylation domain-containing protein